jgi:flagellar FliJ protein
MKRFRFRLQTLLDQRRAREEKLLWELSDLQREELREIERLHGLERILREARESIEEALRNGSTASELVQRDEFAKATRDDIRVQELTIEAVGRRVEAKRVEVVKAMQDRKVLEALKDKQEREYIVSMARQEQNQLDEMATVRYARGM